MLCCQEKNGSAEVSETAYRYVTVRQRRRSEEMGVYVTYGMCAYRKDAGVWRIVACVSDISTDREAVRRLADACTQGNLDPVHILDVVEDILGT